MLGLFLYECTGSIQLLRENVVCVFTVQRHMHRVRFRNNAITWAKYTTNSSDTLQAHQGRAASAIHKSAAALDAALGCRGAERHAALVDPRRRRLRHDVAHVLCGRCCRELRIWRQVRDCQPQGLGSQTTSCSSGYPILIACKNMGMPVGDKIQTGADIIFRRASTTGLWMLAIKC